MSGEVKTQNKQDALLDTLSSEISSGKDNLSAWIAKIDAQKKIDSLFELETWLRGLRAFFDIQHLPLSDAERIDLLDRSFGEEIRTVRQVLIRCDHLSVELLQLDPLNTRSILTLMESELRRGNTEDPTAGRLLKQMKPGDSLAELIASLSDLRILIDSMDQTKNPSLQVFVSLGRSFARQLQFCRYIDLLLNQKFHLQYDKIEDPVLANILRGIGEENLRRNVALSLLHLFRFLKYLRIIEQDIAADLPLRRTLVVFSLLHAEMGRFAEFLKVRFLKDKVTEREPRKSADLIHYLMKSEAQRVLDHELAFVSHESNARLVYARIEKSHGLLLNCCQSAIVSMVQAFEKEFDSKRIFGAMPESLRRAQRLRHDLWDLRQYLKETIDLHLEMDTSRIVERLSLFRESSMGYLMYKDWGEFERLTDSLVGAQNSSRARDMLGQFIAFLEALVMKVSKRSILR